VLGPRMEMMVRTRQEEHLRAAATRRQIRRFEDTRVCMHRSFLAASLEGAGFGLVRAMTSRLSAAGVARATGSWPDS
jgi:hypothetical protein